MLFKICEVLLNNSKFNKEYIKNNNLDSLKILSVKENEISLSYEKNRIKIEEIINLIQENNVKILDISTEDGDLEDVFLGLTKNK